LVLSGLVLKKPKCYPFAVSSKQNFYVEYPKKEHELQDTHYLTGSDG